nr:PAS domain-containing protein [Bradyrhizobium sp. AC87j1]
MIVIDEKGIIRSFSAPAVRLFDWSPDDVAGMNVSRLMPQLYRAEHELHRTLCGQRRAAHHRHRLHRGRRTERRLDLRR